MAGTYQKTINRSMDTAFLAQLEGAMMEKARAIAIVTPIVQSASRDFAIKVLKDPKGLTSKHALLIASDATIVAIAAQVSGNGDTYELALDSKVRTAVDTAWDLMVEVG